MVGIHATFKLALADFALDVDIKLPARGVTAIFGPSGCGKTTLLRCIAGLERALQGFCSVNGEVWQDSQQNIFWPTHKRPLGYVFQEASLFAHLTVWQNLQYGLKRASVGCDAERLGQAVELLGIEHLLTRMPAKLSGGERQRVAIARALAVCPKVLLMDEPLAALDLKRKQEILPFLSRLHNELEIPILYVTHSPQEVTQLADYLVMLEAGKVKVSGTLEQTLTRLDSPLAQGKDASSVLEVNLTHHEPAFHLTHALFAGGDISLPYQPQRVLGSRVRLRVNARDVSIALNKPEQTSILNTLPAIITDVAHDDEGQTLVRLSLNGVALLAHVTYKSALQLNLQPGMQVFAQIKATAIL